MASARKELEARLKAWSTNSGVKVAWEGVPFNKPTSGVFVQPFLIPTATLNPTVDGQRIREVGIFQINVWGLDGNGCGETENVAYQIRDLYPILPKTGSVSVERTPAISEPIIQDGWRVVPVTILYRREL